jgi:hypothetical protein
MPWDRKSVLYVYCLPWALLYQRETTVTFFLQMHPTYLLVLCPLLVLEETNKFYRSETITTIIFIYKGHSRKPDNVAFIGRFPLYTG